MFERFTERARKVVVLAQEEVRHFNHNYIGTEHLLLGLLRDDEGVGARVLGAFDVTTDAVRRQVKSIVGYGAEGIGDQAPFSKRARSTLKMALREALRSDHNYVSTEHILLALIRESEGVAVRALSNLGVDPKEVRREVAMLNDKREQEAPPDADINEGAEVMAFEARVEGLEVHARCGVSDEERALPQTLRVDLKYAYEAEAGDDLAGTVDYGTLVEGVAELLEGEEFKLLETGVRRVGDHVLGQFPAVREVSVSVTKLRVPVARSLSGVSVSSTFRR